LLIDYGTTNGQGSAGEVHGYRRHAVLEDVLADPGSSDVTAGVDLGAVAARGAHGPRVRRVERSPARAPGAPDGRGIGLGGGADLPGPEPGEPLGRSGRPGFALVAAAVDPVAPDARLVPRSRRLVVLTGARRAIQDAVTPPAAR